VAMKPVSALVLVVLVFAGPSAAQDDYPKKIVGKWEITKAGGGASAGTVIEFTKDNKLAAKVKIADMEIKLTGTYKLDKDKLELKLKTDGMEIEETLTIKKLTDEAMELEDKDGKIDQLKKVKDKKDK
jgi:uncharacterized protein (TIGR03066 family)